MSNTISSKGIVKVFNVCFFGILLSLLVLLSACNMNRSYKFDPESEEEQAYDPYHKYYPFKNRYQDSVINEPYDDEPTWPGREDNDLLDDLMR